MAYMYGNGDNETLTGTSGTDTIDGADGDDTLIGGAGADWLSDTQGANVLYGDSADPASSEGSNDTLTGGVSNQLYGGAGNDWLRAAGSSSLVGGSGNDLLEGGTNVNSLEGGSGADTIRGTGTIWTDAAGSASRVGGDQVDIALSTAQAYGAYNVLDFKAGASGDVLNLHQMLAELVPAGFDYRNPLIDQAQFTATGARVVTGTNSWLRIVQNGADAEVQVDPSGPGNGSSYQTVVVLRGVAVAQLQSANFDPPFSLDGALLDANVEASGRILTLDGNDTVTDNAGFGYPDIPGVSSVNSLITTGYGNDRIQLNGGDDTVNAGVGADTIQGSGTSGGGAYYGEQGDDVIDMPASGSAYGGDGNDTLTGGISDDTLDGGAGHDVLSGGLRHDYLDGGDGRDTLDGGSGRDYLDGGAGDDRLVTGVRNVVYSTDPLRGYLATFDEDARLVADENDYLSGGGDSDTMIAGAGDDNLYDTLGANVMFGGSGNDVITGGVSNWVDGGVGDDWIQVGASSTVAGSDGDDTLRIMGLSVQADGGAGNDRFELGDTYTHGAGIVTLGGGRDTVVLNPLALANGATPLEVTDFVTGAGGDVLDVTALLGGLRNYNFDNPFQTGHLRLHSGDNGQDTVLQVDVSGTAEGLNWQDVVLLRNTAADAFTHGNFLPLRLYPGGNATQENWQGDAGSNTYIGIEGADSAQGFDGNDLLDGGFGGSDTLVGGAGADTLFGFGGNDVLYGDAPDGGVSGAADAVLGGAGDDVIYGGDGDDNAYVGAYKGVEYGTAGLDGGSGNDTVHGEAGGDQIYGREGDDSLDGGADNDYIEGNAGNDTLVGGAGNDYLQDYSPQAGDHNLLHGGSGADTLYSYYGVDTLEGGEDNDWLYSLSAQSTLRGEAGDDELAIQRSDSTNRLEGGEGNDTLDNAAWSNDQGNDTFDGGAGDDVIHAAGDGNLIAGGSGADTIVLEMVDWSHGTGEVYLGGLPDAQTGVAASDTDTDIVRLSLRGIEAGRAAAQIHDFHTGQGGDRLDLTLVLGRLSQLGYTFGNPFTTGWLRLLQDGAHTHLQVDTSGPGDGETWSDVAVLYGVDTSTEEARGAMLTYNFTTSFGVNGVSIVGTGADETISDSSGIGDVFAGDGSDSIQGLGGNDLLDGGFGGDDTLVGGAGIDTLFGFDGNDVLHGDTQDNSEAGDQDAILGGAGDDLIYGGDGDDNVHVGSYKGVDYGAGLDGGFGNDTVYGGGGGDQIYGREGNDSLDGGADNDYIEGNAGNDTLAGGAGNDYLQDYSPQPGDHNLLQGGGGADTLYSYYGVDTLEGGDDNDWLYSLSAQSTLRGEAGDDVLGIQRTDSTSRLEGGEGNDTLDNAAWISDQGNDTFDGGAGNDVIHAAGDGNLIAGGSGADTIVLEMVDWSHGTGEVHLGGLPDAQTGVAASDTDTDIVRLSLRGIEAGRAAADLRDFHTGAGGDKLDLTLVLGRLYQFGYTFNNPFTNGWLRLTQVGADTVLQVDTGEPGGVGWRDLAVVRNTVSTSFTEDNFSPRMSPTGFGTGRSITGTEADETISDSVGIGGAFAGDGSDSIDGLAGDDLLDGGFGGNDTLVGGAGRDTLFGFDGNDILHGDTQDNSALGDQDAILGGAGDDLIYGGDGDDNGHAGVYKGVDYGTAGLDGGLGNDTVYGGDGRDQIYGREGNDSLDGGADNDYIEGNAGNDTLVGGAGNDYLQDYSPQAGDHNLLQGGSGADTLYSYYGVDTLEGGDDNDWLYSLSAQSTLRGEAGDDVLGIQRTDSTSRLEGGEGNDTLDNAAWSNDQGNDTFDGGAGDDVIHAAGDGNLIAGGGGADTIVLEMVDWSHGTGEVYLGGLPNAQTGVAASDTDIDIVQLSLRAMEAGRAAPHLHDFHTGAGGDLIDLSLVMGRLSQLGYTFDNPFTTGWLRLVQDAADTRLQVDASAAAADPNWRDLAVLHGTDAASFTQHNFSPRVAPAGLPDAQVITGSGLDETITESAGVNGVFASDGGDSINGLGGNDLLDGGFGGNDTLVGGVGRDTLLGFDGDDVLYGDTPDNSATGDDDAIAGGAGNDLIHGGDGNDNGHLGFYKGVDYGAVGLDGGLGNDTVYGGDGRDQIYGREGNDSLDGGADNDYIEGNAGNDTLVGGAGNDYLQDYSPQPGDHNLLQGGSGADTLYSYYGVDTLEGGDDNDWLYSLSAQSTLRGEAGDDALGIQRSDSINRLEGGEGNDTLDNAAWSNDQGNDTFDGGAGDDVIHAAGDGNLIAGGSGADTIVLEMVDWSHGTGEVYLGGLPDAQTGVAASDTDVDVLKLSLRAIEAGRAAPRIHDFHAGADGDRIDLSTVATRLEQTGMEGGADPFAAGYLRFTNAGSDAILEADLDGATGGSQFRAIAVFKGAAAADFVAANVVQAYVPLVSGNPAAPAIQADKIVLVPEDSEAAAFALLVPFDPDGGEVFITIDAVSAGTVQTAQGATVTAGQSLTGAELAGLTFTPDANFYGAAGTLRYSVQDDEGSVVTGQVTVTVLNSEDLPQGTVSISGTPVVGQTLHAFVDLWDPDGTGAFHYQWLADGQPVANATNDSYEPTDNVVGKGLSVRVTFVDATGVQEGVTSAATDPVTASTNFAPTGSVTILLPGAAEVPAQRHVLSVLDTLEDQNGMGTVTYEWLADGVVVGSGPSFTLGQEQVGHAISARASYTDGAGVAESVTSDPTQAVANVNDAPAADADMARTNEDTPITIGSAALLSNDDDLDGDALALVGVESGAGGTVVLSDGDVLFTPDPNFNGAASFSYTIADGNGGTASGTVTVAVNPVADATMFTGDVSGSGNEDTTITGTLVASDGDGMTTPRFAVARNGAHGVAGVDASSGAWIYAPDPDWNGTDSFEVSVVDGQGHPASREITVTVAPVADAVADRTVVDEDGQVTTNVLANDSFEGTSAALTGVTQAAHGSVEILDAAAGLVRYTPGANYAGPDSYTYTVGFGGVTETATVDLSVLPVNDAPTGTVTITGQAVAGQTLVANSTLADVDGIPASGGGALAYQWFAGGEAIPGGAGSSYTLTLAEAGRDVSVRASWIDGFGHAEAVSSAAVHVDGARADLQGMAYYWKSHMLLGNVGVEATTNPAAIAAGTSLFDLRGLLYNAADNSVTAQVWVNPTVATANFGFSVTTPGATGVTFTRALASDWMIETGSEATGNLNVSGITAGAGVSTAANLGTVKILLGAGQTAATLNFSGLEVGNTAVADIGMEVAIRTTAGDGQFHFTLQPGGYGVSATRSASDLGNAISSADALAALRMAVGGNPNDPDGAGPLTGLKVSPYQFVAADVNEDTRVTSADALAILRMAVKGAGAPVAKWTFVNETLDLWNEAAAGGGASLLTRNDVKWNLVNESGSVNLQSDTVMNLVGVLRGDVNGNWSAPAGSTDLDNTQAGYFQALATQLGVPTDIWGI